MRIVVRINAQPARDGIVIDADDDNGVRPDFLDLACETAMAKVFMRTRGTVEQDFNIGRRREAAGLVQYYRLRSGTARKN